MLQEGPAVLTPCLPAACAGSGDEARWAFGRVDEAQRPLDFQIRCFDAWALPSAWWLVVLPGLATWGACSLLIGRGGRGLGACTAAARLCSPAPPQDHCGCHLLRVLATAAAVFCHTVCAVPWADVPRSQWRHEEVPLWIYLARANLHWVNVMFALLTVYLVVPPSLSPGEAYKPSSLTAFVLRLVRTYVRQVPLHVLITGLWVSGHAPWNDQGDYPDPEFGYGFSHRLRKTQQSFWLEVLLVPSGVEIRCPEVGGTLQGVWSSFFCIYVLTSCVDFFIGARRPTTGAFIGILIAAVGVQLPIFNDGRSLSFLLWHSVLLYSLRKLPIPSDSRTWQRYLALPLALALWSAALCDSLPELHEPTFASRRLAFCAGTFLFLEGTRGWRSPSWLVMLSRLSLGMNACHMLVLFLVVAVSWQNTALPASPLLACFVALGIYMISAMSAAVLYVFLQHPCELLVTRGFWSGQCHQHDASSDQRPEPSRVPTAASASPVPSELPKAKGKQHKDA
ncbi:unnamed protein product [Polarella glacialis]|uniref:Uncharacterized protein n=1 Tax=Polarella glacialis TaxID=89957 RepID=A0A813F9D1_POLGL|nr:unnamed protein product [Polarella glacialis]